MMPARHRAVVHVPRVGHNAQRLFQMARGVEHPLDETFSISAKTKKEVMLLSVRVRSEPSGQSLALTPMSANARLMRDTGTFVGLRVPFEEVRGTAGPVFLDAVFFLRGDMEAPVVSEQTL